MRACDFLCERIDLKQSFVYLWKYLEHCLTTELIEKIFLLPFSLKFVGSVIRKFLMIQYHTVLSLIYVGTQVIRPPLCPVVEVHPNTLLPTN